jgi:hypothetical protein
MEELKNIKGRIRYGGRRIEDCIACCLERFSSPFPINRLREVINLNMLMLENF